MLTPDPDARRMLVRERHAVLAHDSFRPEPPEPYRLARRIPLRLGISWLHLRPDGRGPQSHVTPTR